MRFHQHADNGTAISAPAPSFDIRPHLIGLYSNSVMSWLKSGILARPSLCLLRSSWLQPGWRCRVQVWQALSRPGERVRRRSGGIRRMGSPSRMPTGVALVRCRIGRVGAPCVSRRTATDDHQWWRAASLIVELTRPITPYHPACVWPSWLQRRFLPVMHGRLITASANIAMPTVGVLTVFSRTSAVLRFHFDDTVILPAICTD